MTARRLVILGATGDLTGRYLVVALAELGVKGCLPDDLVIVGVGQDGWNDQRFRAHAARRLAQHAPHLLGPGCDDLVARLRYVAGDASDPMTLSTALGPDTDGSLVYLALPPALFGPVIEALAATGLTGESRVVIEKPFGTDRAAARELNHLVRRHLGEKSVFRMDHFLGKQTVQNLLGVRFANRLFDPIWCRDHVAAVDIVWDETVALEGRAGYYDHTGALRDMIQNHLLQLLCLMAMERPATLREKTLRDRKVELLEAVRSPTPEEVRTETLRASYGPPCVDDGRRAYSAEPGVDPVRATETLAELTLFVDNDRWHGVPFRLRTGKALARDRRDIVVRFRDVLDPLFGQRGEPPPNRLVLQMDPDRMVLDLALNGAGDPFCLDPAQLALELAPQDLSAYARLLLEALEGDPTLSIRGDEAEECWRIVEPILAEWHQGMPPLLTYPAGSSGPSSSPVEDMATPTSLPWRGPRHAEGLTATFRLLGSVA